MAGTEDDFPTIGGDKDSWGDKLKAFYERCFIMSGDNSGLLALVVNQGGIVTNQGKPIFNVPGV